MSTTTTVTVQGMTCGHCVSSVQAEVSSIDGVTAVDYAGFVKLVVEHRTNQSWR